ncbi:hypothetical protein SteCoe_35968 [Stentor coeruleus]|uniref:Haemolysin-III related n=1 Tax=Stentor coeruleus TaxID=5963 RepID=A0A1R2AR63_9CILI|nr:hypothetical protein SteCoe_35968 [Stentor coeruleus]
MDTEQEHKISQEKKEEALKIGSWNELNEHEFIKDNEYIRHGYRMNFNSSRKILNSLFMIHNETANVWSHLLGVLIFFCLLGYCITWLGIPAKVSELNIVDDLKETIINSVNDLAHSAARYENIIESQMIELYQDAYYLGHKFEERIFSMYNRLSSANETSQFKPLIKKLENIIAKIDSQDYDWIDLYKTTTGVSRWPIFIFIVSAMICLMCSSIFHLFNAHSSKMNRNLSSLDYAGTSILIAGSFYPTIYYTFYCYPSYIVLYLSGISVASIITFVISFIPSFQDPSMRWFRGMLFVVLSFLGFVPMVHLYFLPQSNMFANGLIYFALMGVSYLTGVAIYISRVPERFYPGKFDFIGSSHNIWHLFVLSAALFHYLGSLDVYHTRQSLTCFA